MRNQLFLALVLTVSVTACSKKNDQSATAVAPPVIAKIEQKAITVPNTLNPDGSAVVGVVSEVTVNKDALLGRTFLYGGTVQAGSYNNNDDPANAQNLTAINLGQLPAQFKILDNKLRLVSDESIGVESDVNHPSRLIEEFVIVKQDDKTITFRADRPSPILPTMIDGTKTPATLTGWIRSMEFVANDQIFMIESSIELKDGSRAEFMETLIPRDKQVPANATALLADKDLEPLADRYRFLSAGDIWINHPTQGRVKSAAAERFLLQNGQPVRWWVTANAPEKYMVDIKNAIEGWNRYSRAAKMKDIIKFEGVLPAGVKVGDPRYNVIVWDNIADAPAAYESQNADPTTGVQLNSIIYIPLAWVNIGKDYWNKANLTDASQSKTIDRLNSFLKEKKFGGRNIPLNCLDSAELHLNLASKEDPEAFARGLLKGVIFHEVGHSFGLAHNFKGSLSFDPDYKNGSNAFSTSIMDYNHYNEEESAFISVESSDGPLLEYDRQIISVLYNNGKDVKDSDPVVPACADGEADSKDGGIDPLCNRYDIGSDITKQILRELDLIKNPEARNGKFQSLPKAILASTSSLPDPTTLKSKDEVMTVVKKLLTDVGNVAGVYIGGTANSIAYESSQAAKSLFVFRKDVLPAGYVENDMRDRAYTATDTVLGMNALPDASKASLNTVRDTIKAWAIRSPAFASLADDARKNEVDSLVTKIDANFANMENAVLSKMRSRLVSVLSYSDKAPLNFLSRNGQQIDLEQYVIGNLERLITDAKIGTLARPIAERLGAAKSLNSFVNTTAGRAALDRAKAKLTTEITASTDARGREDVRKVLLLLK